LPPDVMPGTGSWKNQRQSNQAHLAIGPKTVKP